MKRKLVKRNYLGEGYVHQFKNIDTGHIINVPCTKEEYIKLGLINGSDFNPILEGYIWVGSVGGTDMVDTKDTVLGEDEYCIKNNKAVVVLSNKPWFEKYQVIPIDFIDENHYLDETKMTELNISNTKT